MDSRTHAHRARRHPGPAVSRTMSGSLPIVGSDLTSQALAQFRAALIARDIVPPDPIVADGRLHRCNAVGRRGRGDAAYLLHLDGIPAGGLENWRDGRGWESWRCDIGHTLSRGEREWQAKRAEDARLMRERETAARHAQAAARAAWIWAAAKPATPEHPYLARKGVLAHELRAYRGVLLVPVRDMAGELQALQFIAPGGAKRFSRGARVQGCCCWIGEVGDLARVDAVVCLAEGFATGASVHEATGHPVAVGFHAGNLAAVARAIRERWTAARIVVCADDDERSAGNPGLTHAREAARVGGGLLALPHFGGDRPPDATDFNDLHRLRGLSAVRTCVENAAAPSGAVDVRPGADGPPDWPEPEPLTTPLDPLPYPVDALPSLLREAVEEAQAFVQAPMALVACSALAALSVAAQGLVNVRRDHQLVGPVSLYLLAVAESGERKTSCDRIFGQALRDWERERVSALAPELAAHDAAAGAFEAKRAGLLEAIKRKRRDAEDTAADEAALDELTAHTPQPVPVPRLLYADATPEALSHSLARGWPSGAVMSAEAGAVFGAHGMGYETILRNLALLNVLWDGGEIAIDRRSKSSFQLRDRRLTFGLMIQPETLRGFLERAGSLPRGSGFIARFLIAWPASTQGTRAYRPAPERMPAVERFGQRVRELLDTPLCTYADGGLQPIELALSPPAHAAWVQAHDRIERALAAGGDFADIRDVAAKAAENVARLASLFHVLTHGPGGVVNADGIDAAANVIGWHLHEARRLLSDLDTPSDLVAAIRLDAWLIAEARRSGDHRIPTPRVYQFGPGCVRDAKALKAALALLIERSRARMEEDGKRRFVVVNPALAGR
jgi:putative DNA primase/helicase